MTVQQQSLSPVRDRRRILVVDDEAAIRDLLSTALRYMGYDVTTAHTGAGALQAAADTSPDLIVLDVMLPDIDGSRFAAACAPTPTSCL